MSLFQTLLPPVLGDVGFINTLLSSFGTTLGAGIATIPAFIQNGNSPLGLLPVPVLPDFLGGSDSNDVPWGNRTAGDSAYEDPPDTGRTRYYDFTVSRGYIAPDGIEKHAILVNGMYPGPTIKADWGDWIEVIVRNNITGPEDGTAIHMHGITMKGHQEMDGVPGISQCPIAPGHSMTYRFHADLYGTSWWHSHYSAQTTDGVFGPLVIHGPKNAPYDIDLGPVMVGDYYRKPSEEVLHQLYSTNIIEASTTFADGTLISGKMQGDCSKVAPGTPCSQVEMSKFEFEPGKTHRLRFISPASFGVMLVSIDDHDMTVIANDFVPVVPYTVKTITLAAGQRMDVLVKAKTTVRGNGAYWLRVRQPTLCALAFQPFAMASIHYKGYDTDATPLSLPQPEWLVPRLLDCQSDPLRMTEPMLPFQPPEPDVTLKVDIKSYTNASGHILYYMNGNTFRANYNSPTLLTAQAGNLSQLEAMDDKNVYNFGTNQSVRIVFQNYVPFSHPMHVHGQNMYVLDEGVGMWNGQSVVRPQNPQRRDTQIIQPSGYIVVQLDSTNPGVWPFHCHFTWHVSQGLYINVVQRPDDIVARTELPEQLREVCEAWDEWSSVNTVPQIDSGVKLRFLNIREELPAKRSWAGVLRALLLFR